MVTFGCVNNVIHLFILCQTYIHTFLWVNRDNGRVGRVYSYFSFEKRISKIKKTELRESRFNHTNTTIAKTEYNCVCMKKDSGSNRDKRD